MASPHKNPLTVTAIIVLVVLIVITSLIVANINFALRFPGGNDFMVHWLGFRKLITEGTSPYSQETLEAVQTFAQTSGLVNPKIDIGRIVYPLYSVLIYLPFALVKDFVLARALWMVVLELNLLLLAYLSMKLSGWKTNTIVLVFYYLFAVLFFHSVIPVESGNSAVLVAVFLAGGLLAVKNRADELAGVLFAFSAIKPQVVLFFSFFILIWSLRQRRQKIAIWFGFTLLLLILSSMLIQPDWIPQNLMEIFRYVQTGPVTNFQWALGEMLPGFGSRVGWAAAAVLVLLLMVEWGLAARFRFKGFLFGAIITLLANQWMGLPSDVSNLIVLFPAIPVIFEAWSRRWQRAGGLYILICLFSLLIVIYIMYFNSLNSGYPAQLTPIMFLPLPVFLYIALYWSRWWILQPDSDLALDAFRDEDQAFFE